MRDKIINVPGTRAVRILVARVAGPGACSQLGRCPRAGPGKERRQVYVFHDLVQHEVGRVQYGQLVVKTPAVLAVAAQGSRELAQRLVTLAQARIQHSRARAYGGRGAAVGNCTLELGARVEPLGCPGLGQRHPALAAAGVELDSVTKTFGRLLVAPHGTVETSEAIGVAPVERRPACGRLKTRGRTASRRETGGRRCLPQREQFHRRRGHQQQRAERQCCNRQRQSVRAAHVVIVCVGPLRAGSSSDGSSARWA